ncbi:heavy metal-associated isoprenylated plant protein 37-like [Mangifera indica]|uniref:heavy metal-associated isoprenylated plant protein 37-like n=1 Tax=Mangifera indica TaxID=29780 RepID=UPI001CFBD714|nr:heavy metal-associated isoprenylated plant protein 37-like [Mangifera indica]XP_044488254.1 heavy metal-associated isoprenylated plant protein 37-like [Mangifera indica]
MTKEDDFKLLKIQTCVLKVNIHCDGCKQKVKKLLQRIEGVYQVNIDADQQKVTVLGSVDSATLIKKLVRNGKHAELWSQKSNQNQSQSQSQIQNQKQKINCIKDDKKNNNQGQKQGLMKGLEALKNQHKFPLFISEEGGEFYDDDEDDEEDELQFLKANQLGQFGLLRQQAMDANNAKKGVAGMPGGADNINKMNNNGGNTNAGKKGNPNQVLGGMNSFNPSGIDPKTMAALKMNNVFSGGGHVNVNGDGKRANDINAMMGGLGGGYHGNGANIVSNTAAALGGNPNGLVGFQHVQPTNGYQNSAAGGLTNGGYATGQQYPSSMPTNMNGGYSYNHPSAQMMTNMNMQNRHAIQQPQMMYHRSPFIPPNTGYFYNYNPAPYPFPEQPPPQNYSVDHLGAPSSDMVSDENTSSCTIM